MKSLLFFSIIALKGVFSLDICFLNRYQRYEYIFTKIYHDMVKDENVDNDLKYHFYPTISDFFSNSTEKTITCDVGMIEPIYYDKYFDELKGINDDITPVIKARSNDNVDGQIYKDLISDIQLNRNTVNALPLFLDYGILYYRSDIDNNPPRTWEELLNVREKFKDKKLTDSIFIYQFSNNVDYYYTLFENVLNTEKSLNFDVIKEEVGYFEDQMKKLFDKEIIDDYAFYLNSEYSIPRFTSGYGLYMRNWSSFLYDITKEFSENNAITFDIAKPLYSSERSKGPRAVNKGIYLYVSKDIKDENLKKALTLIETFTSKEFEQNLLKNETFYDIPAYHSLILENKGIDNQDYCQRINCTFFNDIAKDHYIPAYQAFYQDNLLSKFLEFFKSNKQFFQEADGKKDDVMKLFENLFKESYNSSKKSSNNSGDSSNYSSDSSNNSSDSSVASNLFKMNYITKILNLTIIVLVIKKLIM